MFYILAFFTIPVIIRDVRRKDLKISTQYIPRIILVMK